jgi:hypothetical protein
VERFALAAREVELGEEAAVVVVGGGNDAH